MENNKLILENNDLSNLESRALELLLAGDDPILKRLRIQNQSLKVDSRTFTGAGFYLELSVVDKESSVMVFNNIKPSFWISDIQGLLKSDNDTILIGFVLWIKDGYLDNLEGFTYEKDWPTKINNFELSYILGVRNLEKLKTQWYA